MVYSLHLPGVAGKARRMGLLVSFLFQNKSVTRQALQISLGCKCYFVYSWFIQNIPIYIIYISPYVLFYIYSNKYIYIIKSNDSIENLSDKRDHLKTIYMKKKLISRSFKAAEMYVLKLSICSFHHAVPKQMLFTQK